MSEPKIVKPVILQKPIEQIPEVKLTIPDAKPGQLFDIIYYSPEHKNIRFQYLKRLPKDELLERRFKHGMVLSSNRHFPKQFLGQEGYKTFANITCRAFYGATYLVNYEKLEELLSFYIIQPGLIGADIDQKFLESNWFEVEMSKPDFEREENDRAIRQQVAFEEQENNLNARYLLFIAYRLGIPNVNQVPYQVLVDIVGSALTEPQNSHLPDIETWKAINRIDVILPEVRLGRDEEFDLTCGQVKKDFSPNMGKI